MQHTRQCSDVGEQKRRGSSEGLRRGAYLLVHPSLPTRASAVHRGAGLSGGATSKKSMGEVKRMLRCGEARVMAWP